MVSRGRFTVLASLAAASLVASAVPVAALDEGAADDSGRQRFIASLKAGLLPDAVAADVGRRFGASVDHVYHHALNGFALRLPPAAADALRRDPRVRTVVEDRTVSLAAQSIPTGIARVGGPQSAATAGDGAGAVDVDVAVIDTGIDIDHPDLNVAGGTNCAGTTYDDEAGHGTHVAGTIGAKDNGIGVVGVVPGARLWAVRVFGSGTSTSWSRVICGLDWVTARASTIEVANLSLAGGGGEGSCTDGGLHQAVCAATRAGVTVVVAAGNDAANAANYIPAAFNEVLTVSALADFDGDEGGKAAATCRSDRDDTFASFSNYGADIDFIAPGVCINSTYPGGGYRLMSGTSMAAPHVAGAAALIRATTPSVTLADIRATLTTAHSSVWSNADDRDSTKEPLALVGVPGTAPPPPPPPPPPDPPPPDPPPPDPDPSSGTPTAAFSADCAALKCWFTDRSTDADGSIVARSWKFGDGATATTRLPVRLYAAAGSYTVELTVTDNGGRTATTRQSISVTNAIRLSDTESLRSGGLHTVDLKWWGATGADVDVYRDGVKVVTTANDGLHRDELATSATATYRYKVCQAGSTTLCSNLTSATFA